MTQVVYEVVERVARIRLDRPPVNAHSLEFIRSLNEALRRAATDSSVRAVVLASAIEGRFSAGLDLDILLGQPIETIREFLTELYINLYDIQHTLGKPSIAAVTGAARGGGVTMAISCDMILAGESASFGYPEIDVGMLPAIHYAHLPRIVGRYRAFEMLFTGRSFTADEAARLGLVSRVTPDAELEGAAMELAGVMASKAPDIMRRGRAAFMRQNDFDYRRAIAVAVEDFCVNAVTPSAQEGLRAFVEKRPPRWPD